jgi:uncharacterized protein YjbI with pentapeptide repeats
MSRPPIAQPLPFDISNWSFRGLDCEGWNFSGRDIRGCDFRNAKLKGANFSGAIAGANQKQRFKHKLIMIPVVITGLAIGAFLVGVNAGGISSPVAAVLYWKKRPVTFDFASTGIFWGAFLCASIRIISALTNGRTAYGMGMAAIAFLVIAIFWTDNARMAFKSKIGTNFKNANLEGANFSDALLDNCDFNKANLVNVRGFSGDR